MKTTFFAATLVVALTLSAAAAQKPAVSHHRAGNSVEPPQFSGVSVPPVLCDPCLFYGGDLNPSDFNAAGMSDENTLLIVGGGNTYGNFNVPSGATYTVTGILFNVQADANFDPLTATYDVRTGVTEGNGGTSIASGSGSVAVIATGRNFLGLNEYSLVVQLATPLTIGPGGYWFNMTPSCTNGGQDGSCYVGRFFVSNTTSRTNALRGKAQPIHEMFFNSSFFGLTWANWCDSNVAGFNPIQCGALSFGLLGQ
ncbi:MAG TPA: hypothetical protein VN310_17665 [Candidatus Dormibacteraeota bacterium]|nr:hypothetical protein [Candidatus Dormibacteraeota bacterium]